MSARRQVVLSVCIALLGATLWRTQAARHSTAPEPVRDRVAQPDRSAQPAGVGVRATGEDGSTVAVTQAATLGVHDMAWRPTPANAHRNAMRSSAALFFRPLNIDEATIQHFADGTEQAAIEELTARAATGDPAAITALGALAAACRNKPPDDYLKNLAATQKMAATKLPAGDAGWFETRVDLDLAESLREGALCDSLRDLPGIARQLSELARDGDAAAEWVQSAVAPSEERKALWRDSALQSFAPAEFLYAKLLLEDTAATPAGDPTVLDMLRHAADSLPEARGFLATCELSGCLEIESDVATAAADARVAAEQGSPDVLIGMSKQLPLSVLSADELEAWTLFKAGLELRGCGNPDLNAEWMAAVGTAFSAPAATPAARRLGEQYWQRYGAGAMANLGC